MTGKKRCDALKDKWETLTGLKNHSKMRFGAECDNNKLNCNRIAGGKHCIVQVEIDEIMSVKSASKAL